MQIRPVTLACIAICLAAGCHAGTPPQAAPAASSIQLTPYTAPDQSASAGVPAGWKVTSGGQTAITMTGPQGEFVQLGSTFVAQNAAFQLGQRGSNGIDLSMPYSASLAQKLTMILQQNAALSGKPVQPITFNSTTPVQMPASLGQCARFIASTTGDQGPVKLMAVFCSLPLDPGGAYKNILVWGAAPTALAAQAAPIAQAVFRSYKIPPAWMQRKLAPHNAPQPTAAGLAQGAMDLQKAAAINHSTALSIQGANTSANCFSIMLEELPAWQTPRSCGGTKPD